MPASTQLRWWHFGLIGGLTLSLATMAKFVAALPRLVGRELPWSELAHLPFATFSMGFVCGCLVWFLRGISSRFGAIGDAIIGAVVMNVFFLCCMLCFDPNLLIGKSSGREAMLAGATLIGLIGGVWCGRDWRRDFSGQEGTESE